MTSHSLPGYQQHGQRVWSHKGLIAQSRPGWRHYATSLVWTWWVFLAKLMSPLCPAWSRFPCEEYICCGYRWATCSKIQPSRQLEPHIILPGGSSLTDCTMKTIKAKVADEPDIYTTETDMSEFIPNSNMLINPQSVATALKYSEASTCSYTLQRRIQWSFGTP
jgi:hypothetical protein